MPKRAIFQPSRRAGKAAASRFGAALGAPSAAKGNKFDAKKTACQHGHRHDSKAEARRCNELHLLARGGAIADLEVQPQFWFAVGGVQMKHENGRSVGYRGDFAYVERGRQIVEDVKGGYRDDAWTLRKAIFRALFPQIELREVK